jgi:hypothetical protein
VLLANNISLALAGLEPATSRFQLYIEGARAIQNYATRLIEPFLVLTIILARLFKFFILRHGPAINVNIIFIGYARHGR